VDQGQTVFLISWVNPDKSLSHLSWDDYVEQGVFKAIDTARAITESDKVNVVAWCVGGTILASALAVQAARKETSSVSSATFLTTLTNFEEPGDLGIFLDEQQFSRVENQIKEDGVLDGKSLSTTFNMLRSNDLIWSYVVNNYLKGQAPAPFDILYWNSDPTNLPATMYSFYINNMYLENKLCQPGALTICGEKVDLSTIKVPCYFFSAIDDHIAPWKSTFTATDTFKAPIEFVLGASGHIAGVINPVSKNRRHFWVNGTLGEGADHWLETAEKREGSWWSHSTAWIKKRGGKQVTAPSACGSEAYPQIEPAPGRYVMRRIN
jgi:polyhydroxyalkanoate synthase